MRSTTFRLPGDLVDKLDAYAASQGSDRSTVIREVLQQIADGTIAPAASAPERRLAVRVDEDTFEAAAAAVATTTGSERKLNAVLIEGLLARLG